MTEERKWKITIRYVIFNNLTKKCSEYSDIVIEPYKLDKSGRILNKKFALFLCRYSKTSCLNKMHKYVFQLIMKFMTNDCRHTVDNSKNKIFNP